MALFDAYVAYSWTYRMDASRGVVIHHAEGDLSDTYIERDEERPYELAGDRLTLNGRWRADGKEWVGTRVFERIK